MSDEQTPEELAAALLRELGEPDDDESVYGFICNQGVSRMRAAAEGDVTALIEVRQQCGLSVFS